MSSLPTQLYDGLIVGQYPTGWYNASGSFYAKAVSVAADRYTLLSHIQIQADVGLPGSSVSLSQSSQTTLDLSVATNWASTSPTDYTVAGNRAGKDFYVYGCVPTSGSIIKLVLSSNGSAPTGYTTANSRLLGGFHCLCVAAGTISSHPASGYVAGDIIPNSVWDLNWYAESGIQQGMALDNEINQWVYIYPASGTTAAPVSVFGGTVIVSANWMDAVDAGRVAKMRLPWDGEYQSLAALSNEGTNVSGGVSPVTVGGHSDTAGRRCISQFFLEDCTGVWNHWLQDQSFQYDNSTWVWTALPGGKGYIYREGSKGDVKVVAGGAYADGVNAGSRSRNMSYARSDSAATIGFRLLARHINRNH